MYKLGHKVYKLGHCRTKLDNLYLESKKDLNKTCIQQKSGSPLARVAAFLMQKKR